MIKKTILLFFAVMLAISLISCAHELGDGFRSAVISKPEEHKHVYEAKEKVILKSIAGVLEEKKIGDNISIDYNHNRVDSDYVISDDWRIKTNARVKRLNWKECEVSLIVTTEKKTKTGWELRRLLGKDQYDSFFSVIDLKIYEEMYKVE
ncbi:MAG: hypothetical protein K4571_05925 [Deltaproteobacteria bacterium]